MSAQWLPSLCQGATDLDADCGYLDTPVDHPLSCQPYVADCEPVAGYYQHPDGYEGPDFVAGYGGAHYAHNGDLRYLETCAQCSLAPQPAYSVSQSCRARPCASPTPIADVPPAGLQSTPGRYHLNGSLPGHVLQPPRDPPQRRCCQPIPNTGPRRTGQYFYVFPIPAESYQPRLFTLHGLTRICEQPCLHCKSLLR